jgi:cytidylate kinase
MWKNIGPEQALAFIHCQLRSGGPHFPAEDKPVVTISRMTGSGGLSVASKLAEYLEAKAAGHWPWTVFDRNLLQRVLEEHRLPSQLAEFMPEDHRSFLTDTVEELLGLHPSSWSLVQRITETMWNLARLGHVILVGRGANVITRKLPAAFHVRLVGSVDLRAQRLEQARHLSHGEALEFIRKEDLGRRRYLKEHFGEEIDDPLLYHMIINTDQVDCEEAAVLIGDGLLKQIEPAEHRLAYQPTGD